jgi:hypothetical protein
VVIIPEVDHRSTAVGRGFCKVPVSFRPIADIREARHHVIDGGTMNEKLRIQLLEARENIGSQLEQLERDGNSFMQPDCRDVYADLQRELHEINILLAADGGTEIEAETAYQPMIKLYADGMVGNPAGLTLAGRVIAIITVSFFVLFLAIAVLKAWAQ